MVIGAHEVVGAGLAGGIRAVRVEWRFLGERGVFHAERAVNLVGGDVQETEGGLVAIAHPVPVAAYFLQQVEGADDVGLDEDVPTAFARLALDAGEVHQIASVSDLVEVDDRLAVLRQPVEYEICSDETGAAGDQNHDF